MVEFAGVLDWFMVDVSEANIEVGTCSGRVLWFNLVNIICVLHGPWGVNINA